MTADSEFTPSLNDLTFDVEPRREWTPPNPHSPEAGKLWEASESLRTVTSTSSATVSRPSITSKPSTRPSTDTRVYDIRRAHPPSMLTPVHKPSNPLASIPPNKQPTPSSSPETEPSPASEPKPSAAVPESTNAIIPEPVRSIQTPPRRGNVSPVRVVCPEPSLAQLSLVELPSVRGQNVTSISPASAPAGTSAGPGGSGAGSCGAADGAATGGAGGAGFAARRLPAAPGPAMLPDVAGANPLADHVSGISSQKTSSNQDPVDAYLARYQMHQRIKDQFRVRHDEHFRTVQELGARIQAMTKGVTAGAGKGPKHGDGPLEAREDGAAEGTAPLSPSGDAYPPRHGTASSASIAYHQHHYHQHERQQQLPDHPLRPRNRFVPQSAATYPSTNSPASASSNANPANASTSTASPRGPSDRHRPNSASSLASCPSPTRCASAQLLKSGLTGDGTEPSFGPSCGGGGGGSGGNDVVAAAAAAPRASPIAPRGPHPQQGAYLALPDGSFAGSAPLRGMPTTEGLLFEKYTRKSQAVDLPELQLRYIRPGIVAPREPRQLRQVPRQPPPPSRALPNGIPASRLERLSARRRDRSPPRLHQQQILQHLDNPAELLKFTGAPVASISPGSPGNTSPTGTFSRGNAPAAAAAGSSAGYGDGLAAVGDGLLRSASLVTPGPAAPGGGGSPGRTRSPGARAASAPSGPEGGAGTLAQYLAVSTAGQSGEPLLDENFFEVLQQHFRSSMHAQTHQLRSQLNVNLPLVLGALNCVNVTDAAGAGGNGSRRGSTPK
ncbi:hypothetical protein VaNZ11_010325 [Volvox africanus]|uniref:Uncharacterized protein n=1 Tax=Volvox africanus TaxID=51714 RepID=A0ABQ5S9F6_9CHLO|nr:hypothetical protein VaNZ11_010325 [Volvox africanus]